MNDFITLTDLGAIYGVDAAAVGRWLKGLLLRQPDGRPTQQAIKERFVHEQMSEFGSKWLWDRRKTCGLLDSMEYPRGGRMPGVEEHGDFTIFRAGWLR